MKYLNYVLLLCSLALAGCESMSVSQCQVADWGRVGFNDAASGVRETRMADYQEDCGKVGIQPNLRAYRQGWDAGIGRYCTAANGWREGTLGNSSKAAVCQGQTGYDTFAYYLDAGLRVHHTRTKMNQKTEDISRLKKRLDASTSDKDKHRLREELSDLNHAQRELDGLLYRQKRQAP
ncbi:MAG: DUF2799 domain-containing protein [Rhodoferax sp.]|nr:DUF2799 domain-containing protein [Rhodoferax sp.]